MDLLTNIGVVFLAALIHANFQLPLGCFILLSRDRIRRRKSKTHSSSPSGSFIAGIGITTMLLIFTLNFLLNNLFNDGIPAWLVFVEAGILFCLAITIWSIYYRRGHGTQLWIPRGMANSLETRSFGARSDTDAFGLGVMSIVCELPLSFILIFVASSNIIALPSSWQLLVSALYVIAIITPALIASQIITRSSNLSRVQKWRESNKTFTLFILVFGFFIISAYTIVRCVPPIMEIFP